MAKVKKIYATKKHNVFIIPYTPPPPKKPKLPLKPVVSILPTLFIALLLLNAFLSVFSNTINDHIFTDLFARLEYIDAPILRSYLTDTANLSQSFAEVVDWSTLSQIPIIGLVVLALRDVITIVTGSAKLIAGVIQVAFQLLTAVL